MNYQQIIDAIDALNFGGFAQDTCDQFHEQLATAYNARYSVLELATLIFNDDALEYHGEIEAGTVLWQDARDIQAGIVVFCGVPAGEGVSA